MANQILPSRQGKRLVHKMKHRWSIKSFPSRRARGQFRNGNTDGHIVHFFMMHLKLIFVSSYWFMWNCSETETQMATLFISFFMMHLKLIFVCSYWFMWNCWRTFFAMFRKKTIFGCSLMHFFNFLFTITLPIKRNHTSQL